MTGLKERRARVAIEEGWLDKRNAELSELCGGAELAYTIDWESFAGDEKGLNWLEHNGPQQVACACRVVGQDAVGKQALKEGVRAVQLKNCASPDEKSLSFEDGVLTLVCAFAQSPGGRFKDREIRDLLESKL